MDTNSIYESFGLQNEKTKVVKESFYTEKIKEEEPRTAFKRIKDIIMKWLSK